jgi:hypothetical protein
MKFEDPPLRWNHQLESEPSSSFPLPQAPTEAPSFPLVGLRLAGLILSYYGDRLADAIRQAPRNGPSDHSPELSPFTCRTRGLVFSTPLLLPCQGHPNRRVHRRHQLTAQTLNYQTNTSHSHTRARARAHAPPISTRSRIPPTRQTRLDQDVPHRSDILPKVAGT